MVDATGLIVLPGVIDVHTHTRVATDEAPDRFFQDSVAAAFGGTTTFLSFNNPGTGSSAAATRSLRTGLREWLAATAGDSAVDVGLSAVISASHADAVAEIPHLVDGGVPTFKAFMVYDFGVDDATLLALLGAGGGRGRDARGPLREPDDPRGAHGPPPGRRRDRAGVSRDRRGRRTSRPRRRGRAIALAEAADAPLYVVHLSSAAALRGGARGARRRPAGVRRDLPPLPDADRRSLRACRPRRRRAT